MTGNKKAIYGWAIYDWANSAFATTVMAGFFPLFFKQFWSAGVDVNLSTARLGFGNALAGLLVALLAPVLGAVADQGSFRKRFLIGFAYLGVLMTAALSVVEKGRWEWAVAVYALGTIGFSGANVFYDALLPRIATEKELERVSSLGYALGYLGGGLLFLLNVMMTLHPANFGLPDATAAVRLSFLTVALWWGGFTVFTIRWVPEVPSVRREGGRSLFFSGLGQLADTFREIRGLKTVWLFLLAYWCYIDGVDTIVRMAVDYGLSLGFGSGDLISALLMVQFVGFPAAIAYGKLGARWGERRAIFLAIGGYILITLWGAFMRHRGRFLPLGRVDRARSGRNSGLEPVVLRASHSSRSLRPVFRVLQYAGKVCRHSGAGHDGGHRASRPAMADAVFADPGTASRRFPTCRPVEYRLGDSSLCCRRGVILFRR